MLEGVDPRRFWKTGLFEHYSACAGVWQVCRSHRDTILRAEQRSVRVRSGMKYMAGVRLCLAGEALRR